VAGLDDAVRSAEVLDAVERSAREQHWVPVPSIQGSPR
jgi:RIO-like serine/threonine protein kinase